VAKNLDKFERKELKHPDQFVSFWTHFWAQASRVLAANSRQMIVGVAVLALVIVSTVAYAQVRARRAEVASQALARIDHIATADLLPADAVATPPKDDGLPHFKTDKERLEAALKEVEAFLTTNTSSRLRPEALLHKGAYLLGLGRFDEAVAAYTQLLEGNADQRLRLLANEGLGYALEAKGDLDKAAAAFGRLREGTGTDAKLDGFYQDRALYHQARLTEIKGNRADAAKIYRELLDKAPNSSLRDEVYNRLAVLESK
jgi:tetratricopeptide (TPR) repeat protein